MRSSYTVSFLFLLACCCVEAESLNVTNFGALGNATRFTVNAAANSVVLTTTNQLATNGIVGMAIEVFGAGPLGVGPNATHQDIVAFVTNIVSATNIYLDRVAGFTTNNVWVTMGTHSSTGFQACVNAASSVNTTITIPAGNYLLIPPAMFTNFTMANKNDVKPAAVVVSKGGINFQGAGMTNTVLLGCGAWMLKGSYVHRGNMFWCAGPITNDAPLIFADLTMDGGVQRAFNAADNYWPAKPATGTGWDETHDAVLDIGAPLHQYKEFRNCRFTHWLGETLITVSSWQGGMTVLTNCQWIDGNASAVNLGAHQIVNCLVSNYNFSIEFYAGYPTNASSFKGSTLVNCVAGMVMTGAETNRVMPNYTISGNTFSGCTNWSLLMGPTRNLEMFSNNIVNGGGVITGGAYQSTTGDHNENIAVYRNNFTNVYIPINFDGTASDRIANVVISNNIFHGCGFVASGVGTISNVVFRNNLMVNPNGRYRFYGQNLSGESQWFTDDLSNQFLGFDTTDSTGITNTLTYATGMRQNAAAMVPGCIFKLDDSSPSKVPLGALLLVTNTGAYPVTLYRSTASVVAAITVTNGYSATFRWTNGAWQSGSSILPPGNLRAFPAGP